MENNRLELQYIVSNIFLLLSDLCQIHEKDDALL